MTEYIRHAAASEGEGDLMKPEERGHERGEGNRLQPRRQTRCDAALNQTRDDQPVLIQCQGPLHHEGRHFFTDDHYTVRWSRSPRRDASSSEIGAPQRTLSASDQN